MDARGGSEETPYAAQGEDISRVQMTDDLKPQFYRYVFGDLILSLFLHHRCHASMLGSMSVMTNWTSSFHCLRSIWFTCFSKNGVGPPEPEQKSMKA